MCHPYLALLLVGLAVPLALPKARCALTAPFHPYRDDRGGLFSVALSLGSPPPGVTRHQVSMEPGLSSKAYASAVIQPSGSVPINGYSDLSVKQVVQRTQDALRLGIGNTIEQRRPEMPLKRADDDLSRLVIHARNLKPVTITLKRAL